MYKWIVNNFWLKMICLILAIVTWFYISSEEQAKKEQIRYYPQTPVTSKP